MNHRKLISDTVTVNITAFCGLYCDPKSNFSGYCPDLCFYDCPSSCNISPPHVPITTVHHSRAQDNLHLSLIIVLSLIGLACFFYCLLSLYKHFKSMRRPLQEQETHDLDEFLGENQGPILDHPIWYIRTVGLETPVINSISVCKYKRGEGLVEGTDCSVCLSEFEDDETLRLLPKCNHAFHVPCIDTWLRSHTNCPLCRAPIVSVPNGTLSPILEQSLVDSVREERNRLAVSEEREEVERGRNDRDFGSKSVGSSGYWRGIKENEVTDEVQVMRRSVSMNSIALGNVDMEDLNKTNTSIVLKGDELNQGLRICVGGSSFKRSLHKGLVSMKRSSSCSENFLHINPALPV